jgi:hypothetical protein
MKSSLLLSSPGLLFSLVFTFPNYFQLKTVLEENLTLISEDSDFWMVSFHPCNISQVILLLFSRILEAILTATTRWMK